jgi:phenylalanyl-tRNA synthetase beta chain
MICSARELGLGDDHSGIIVLPGGTAQPGDDARPLLGLDDVVVEVEITPDRGYELSVRGIARELSRAGRLHRPGRRGCRRRRRPPRAVPGDVEDTVGCDRFAARAVRGIDPAAPPPEWMQRR